MKYRRRRTNKAGFTRTDLFVIVAVVCVIGFFVIGVLLPAMTKAHSGPRYSCANNLKQVGLAFRMWANDHNNKFPMQVSARDGGGAEFLDATNFSKIFQVISNELGSPRVLVCPQDKNKSFATNFTTDFNQNHLSYFLGLDAMAQMTNSFLSGDRNLTSETALRNGILEVTANQSVDWTRKIHHFQGNIAFPDGSVRNITNSEMHAAIQKTGLRTSRLALP